jgi:GST-like protein
MAQSSAIMMYCAEKTGRFIPTDPAKRAVMLEAYMSASTDITPMFGAVNTVVRSKEPHEPTVDVLKSRLRSLFETWDGLLAKRKYAAGNELTIADLSLYAGYWRTMGAQPDIVKDFINLARWAAEMAARPGIQKALKI